MTHDDGRTQTAIGNLSLLKLLLTTWELQCETVAIYLRRTKSCASFGLNNVISCMFSAQIIDSNKTPRTFCDRNRLSKNHCKPDKMNKSSCVDAVIVSINLDVYM